jgi:transposase
MGLCRPYLTLMCEDAAQCRHDLGKVVIALRRIMRTGAPWRYLADDLLPWQVDYEQSRRWVVERTFAGPVASTAWPETMNACPK